MNDVAVERFLAQLPGTGGGADWLRTTREEAARILREIGFPNRRQEDWRYTDISALLDREFSLSGHTTSMPPQSLIDAIPDETNSLRLIFFNGRHVPELSSATMPSGCLIIPMARALQEHADLLRTHLTRQDDSQRNGFTALNSALMGEGAVVHIHAGIELDRPIHLVFLSDRQETSVAANPGILIVLERQARACLIESWIGGKEAEYLTNSLTRVELGEGASLQHIRLQEESAGAWHIGHLFANQARDSVLSTHSISLGGRLSRLEMICRLNGSGAHTTLNGLFLGRDRQHNENRACIEHHSAHTTSEQTWRGILDDHSRGVFNGRILVSQDAQKTDARLANANLLLSQDAEIDTKPELEIYADDVKCSHGATVGQLDPNMLYYLRSRAIPEDVARSLLVYAFAGDVIRRIPLTAIRERLEYAVAGRLPDAAMIREFIK